MEEIGVVKEIVDSHARVEMQRTTQCEQCGMCLQSGDDQILFLDVENTVDAHPGDSVRIALTGGSVLAASFWVYGMPLVGLVGGAFIGVQSIRFIHGSASFLPAIGAFIGMCMGVAASMLIDRKAQKTGKYKPQIIEVIK